MLSGVVDLRDISCTHLLISDAMWLFSSRSSSSERVWDARYGAARIPVTWGPPTDWSHCVSTTQLSFLRGAIQYHYDDDHSLLPGQYEQSLRLVYRSPSTWQPLHSGYYGPTPAQYRVNVFNVGPYWAGDGTGNVIHLLSNWWDLW